MDWDELCAAIEGYGFLCRGSFRPRPEDGVPGSPRTVVMVGNAGSALWRAFAGRGRSTEATHISEPLDAWVRSAITAIAQRFGATAYFPFDGPPFLPFLSWAQRADTVFPSPLGLLIHPRFGLWHAYRGALGFHVEIATPPAGAEVSPCRLCANAPCLTACPVDAWPDGHYVLDRCLSHLRDPKGTDCMARGCRARRACPVGTAYCYAEDHAAFHMAAFVRAAPELAGAATPATGAPPQTEG